MTRPSRLPAGRTPVGQQPCDRGLDRGCAVGRLEEGGPDRRRCLGLDALADGRPLPRGSILSISSWSVRCARRIRAWNANPVRERSAVYSSSSRTDQLASASASAASRARAARRSAVSASAVSGWSRTACSAASGSRSWSRTGATARTAAARAAASRPPHGVVRKSASEDGEAALGLEVVVAGRDRACPQHRRQRIGGVGEAQCLEPAGVDLDDPSPCRVDVDLGDRHEDRRPRGPRAGEELELRARQLGRRVGHEDEGVGRGKARASRRRGPR